jgi:hypothetical protein
MACAELPPNRTVPVLGVNVPLLIKFPYTNREWLLEIVNPAVDEIEILLQVASANEIIGLLEVIPIVTEVLEVGIPPHQLEAVFQSEVFPSHAPEAVIGIFTELEVTVFVV